MNLYQPPPTGNNYWESRARASYLLRDLHVNVFTHATGPALLRLPEHALYLLETAASTLHSIGDSALVRGDYDAVTLFFIPKNTLLKCSPITPLNISSLMIPDGWFQHALRQVADYDTIQLEPFETTDDKIMVHATALLKNLSLESPAQASAETLDHIIAGLVRRIVQKTKCNAVRRREAITTADLLRVTDFVDANIGRALRLVDLADVAGMSQFYFARAFKAAMNETPMRYVLERRIVAAKVALGGAKAIAVVALDAGFSSQSHFTTSFRLVTGVTPATWRAGRR